LIVSVKRELPPSITMSPFSRSGVRPSMTASVPLPAWTSRMIFLGLERDFTNSSIVFVPTTPPGVFGLSATNLSVFSVVRLKTEIWKPWSAMLSARFWPITASPTRPTSESGLAIGAPIFPTLARKTNCFLAYFLGFSSGVVDCLTS
jgi:hypothetical protein